jgi:hypothetical protein
MKGGAVRAIVESSSEDVLRRGMLIYVNGEFLWPINCHLLIVAELEQRAQETETEADDKMIQVWVKLYYRVHCIREFTNDRCRPSSEPLKSVPD